jgi:hypothetical protein
METYKLEVTKTEEGIHIGEQGSMSDFEIVGLLNYLKNTHALKIQKELERYEQE